LCSRSFVAMARAVSSIVTATSFASRGLVGQPFPVASLGIGRRERLPCNSESIASTFGRGCRSLAQGVHDEADNCDADTGIGDVKGRPGIGKTNM